MTQYNFLKSGSKNEMRKLTDVEFNAFMAATDIIHSRVGYFLSKLYDHNKFDERFIYLVKHTETGNISKVPNIVKIDLTDGYIIPKNIIVNIFKLCIITFINSVDEVTDKKFIPITLENYSEHYNYDLIGLIPISDDNTNKFVFEEDLITCKCPRCSLMKLNIPELWNNWNPTNHLEKLMKEFAMMDFDELFQ